MYKNKVILRGHLGGEPELKPAQSGQSYTRMSLATKRRWRDDQNQWQERTTWHSIIAWGRLADYAAGFKKGAFIEVEGELRDREYDRERDGAHVETYDIVANIVSNLAKNQRVKDVDDNSQEEAAA